MEKNTLQSLSLTPGENRNNSMKPLDAKPYFSQDLLYQLKMSITNNPEVSKTTALSYGFLFIFTAAITVFFLFAAFLTPMGILGIVASAVSTFVAIVMLLILNSLYRTRYILTDEELIIKTTLLIGGSKTILLEAVSSVEKILIPFGIRLFGASFHGGHYHIPGLGKAFFAITNFKDGLLIKTNRRNFVITRSNPLDFQDAIQTRKRHLEKSEREPGAR